MYKLLIVENGTYVYRDQLDRNIPANDSIVLLYSEEETKKYYQKTDIALFNTIEEIEEVFIKTDNYQQEVEINKTVIVLDASTRNLFEIIEA